jgi:hypothetical protein
VTNFFDEKDFEKINKNMEVIYGKSVESGLGKFTKSGFEDEYNWSDEIIQRSLKYIILKDAGKSAALWWCNRNIIDAINKENK